jgi:peroxiredoxin
MLTDARNDTTTLVALGEKSPTFRCTATDGSIFDSSKLKGKVVMINFFATWCPPCKLELPAVQNRIWEKYHDRDDFVLLIIGREQDDQIVADYAKEKGFQMTFASDPLRSVYNLFATQYIPRNIIIDRNGELIFQSRGYSESDLEMIEDLLEKKLNQDH